jgi:hypothetical protein
MQLWIYCLSSDDPVASEPLIIDIAEQGEYAGDEVIVSWDANGVFRFEL